MKIVYFITNNNGKFLEIRKFLGSLPIQLRQVGLELEELQGIDAKKIIEHKAQEAIKAGYSQFILEDTSLYIDGLGKLPGPLIKWFLIELGNEGIYKLAARMGKRKAVAETIIAYVENKKQIHYFCGTTAGIIVRPAGDGDFGWGPIFKPLGADKTFGQMLGAEKHEWSMRIKAFKKFSKFFGTR